MASRPRLLDGRRTKQIFSAERNALQRPAKALPLQFAVHFLRPSYCQLVSGKSERVVSRPQRLEPVGEARTSSTVENSRFRSRAFSSVMRAKKTSSVVMP